MKKILLGSGLLALTFVVGCGSSGSGSSGTAGPVSCEMDSQCGANEACNLLGHVCMQKCTAAADCTDATMPACDPIPGGTQTVCQCSSSASTASCGGGSAYCHPVDKLCETQCSDSSGCTDYNPARSCVNSECAAPDAGQPDAGQGDCTVTGCTAPEVCDTTTKMCHAVVARGTADTQGTCAADQYCDGTNCQTPTACSAVTGGPATTSNSPLIWGVVQSSSVADTSGNCVDASGNELNIQTFTGYYLNEGNGSVPTTGSLYMNVMYVKPSGSLKPTYQTVTVNSSTFTFQICNYTSGDGIHAGVVLIDSSGDDSNVACMP